MGMAESPRKGPHEGVLVHRDSRRLVEESFGADLRGRRCVSTRPEHRSPPLVIRPESAKHREMDWGRNQAPGSATSSDEIDPTLEEMNGTVVMHEGAEFFTLCATSYETNTSYQADGLPGRGQRVAKPNNWRVDRVLREEMERAQQEETRMALETLSALAQEIAQPQEEPSASTAGKDIQLQACRSRGSTAPARRALAGRASRRTSKEGDCAISQPLEQLTLSHDPSPVSVGSRAVPTSHPATSSPRRPWATNLNPHQKSSYGKVPRCASAVPANRWPMSALSVLPETRLRLNSAGTRVYKHPESARRYRASRYPGEVKSVVAQTISQQHPSPDPSAGMYERYCKALTIMNRGMDPHPTGPSPAQTSHPHLTTQLSMADVVKDRVHVGPDHRHSTS